MHKDWKETGVRRGDVIYCGPRDLFKWKDGRMTTQIIKWIATRDGVDGAERYVLGKDGYWHEYDKFHTFTEGETFELELYEVPEGLMNNGNQEV